MTNTRFNSYITRSLKTALLSRPDEIDVLGSLDKISLLWDEKRKVHEHPEDQNMANLSEEANDPIDDVLQMPEIPKATTYLIESAEYGWLLSRIQAAVRTMPTEHTDSTIRRNVSSLLGNGRQIQVDLDWSFHAFLETQYDRPAEVELRDILCCSGLAVDAFATTCANYADLLWPRYGRETIACLSLGLRKHSNKMSGMNLGFTFVGN